MNLRVNDRQEKGVQKRGNYTSPRRIDYSTPKIVRRDMTNRKVFLFQRTLCSPGRLSV